MTTEPRNTTGLSTQPPHDSTSMRETTMRTVPSLFQTHWSGCWRDSSHHECAVAMVERAEELLVVLLDDNDIPEFNIPNVKAFLRMVNEPLYREKTP